MRQPSRWAGAGGAVLCCAALSCGQPPADARDGGGDGSPGSLGDGGTSLPLKTPNLTPCPERWVEESVGAVTVCRPWPETLGADCPVDFEPLPGETDCFGSDFDCPAGQYPTGLLDGRTVLYVDPTVTAGGNGSPETPYRSLLTAYRNAPDGAVLALSGHMTGWLTGAMSFDRPISVTLAGICPPTSTGIAAEGSAVAAGATVELINLTARQFEVAGGALHLRHATAIDIFVSSGTLDSQRSRIYRLCTDGPNSLSTITHSRVGGHPALGFPSPLSVYGGARVAISDSFLEPLETTRGVLAIDPLGTCVLTDGVDVGDGSLTLTRSISHSSIYVNGGMVDIQESALFGGDDHGYARPLDVHSGTASATDSVIRESGVGQLGELALNRVVLDQTRLSGVFTFGTVRIDDLVVLDAIGNQSGNYGRGLEVQAPGKLSANRVAMIRARDVGVLATGEDVTVKLSNLYIADLRPPACADLENVECQWNAPTGVAAMAGSSIVVEGFALERAALAGAVVGLGGHLQLTRGVIRDNPIGVIVDDPDFDLSLLQKQVVWENNGVNIDSPKIGLPQPTPELVCADGIDNDGNGLADCDDPVCNCLPASQ